MQPSLCWRERLAGALITGLVMPQADNFAPYTHYNFFVIKTNNPIITISKEMVTHNCMLRKV